MARRYYSARVGAPRVANLDFTQSKRLFASVFTSFQERHYFQEAIGYYCVDAGEVDGTMGADIGAFFLRKLRKDHLWPIVEKIGNYSREDFFDVIELLYDHVSTPMQGRYHDFSGCGWHYSTFDTEAGRSEFLAEVNDFLSDFEEGYELSSDGEVLRLVSDGLGDLFSEALPEVDEVNVTARVQAAIRKFRGRHATSDDRRDAVRDLADVLEFLRPELKAILSNKDEGDLFNLANNFSIRHHNRLQKGDYDARWLDWIFYVYLATIHTVTQIIAARQG